MCLLYGTDWIFIYNPTFCPHSVFMCFVWIWEQTAIISLYSINWLVCVTETECVYCAVRTGYLYTVQFIVRLGIFNKNLSSCDLICSKLVLFLSLHIYLSHTLMAHMIKSSEFEVLSTKPPCVWRHSSDVDNIVLSCAAVCIIYCLYPPSRYYVTRSVRYQVRLPVRVWFYNYLVTAVLSFQHIVWIYKR